MEQLKKKTETMLRSVLISSPRGVALRRLDKEYKSITYSSIPFREFGFATLEMYLRSIPQVAGLTRDADGEIVVKGVASESDQHVAKLISKQKKPKKRSKPAAKSRRPTFVSKSFPSRPVGMHRQMVFARPGVVSIHVPAVAATARNPVVNTKPSVSFVSARSAPGIRFVPPRMMRQAINQANVHSVNRASTQQNAAANVTSSGKVEVVSQPCINRTVVERSVARQVEQQAQEMASASNRKVTVAPSKEEHARKKQRKKKPKSPGSGPNWQGMEKTIATNSKSEESEHFPLSNSSASKGVNMVDQTSTLSKEEVEVFSRIKKLLDEKPKGLWLKRIGAEYKKTYNEELSSEKLERLRKLPNIARCEEFPGGNIIVYPVQVEEKPSSKEESQTNGVPQGSVELYTLRPQELPAMGTLLEVTVSYVVNPAYFFIQQNQNWEQLDALSRNLDEFFKGQPSEIEALPTVSKGMFCCAQYTEDNRWYRARIMDIVSKGDTPTAQVIYVDFGNHESLPVSRLRMLRKEHAELPMMAALCALEGMVSPDGENWSNASAQRFEELCSAEMLKMRVSRIEGHCLYVQLSDAIGNDLGAALLKEGHAKHDTDSSSITSVTPSSSTGLSSSSSSLTTSSSTDSFSSVTTVTSTSSSSSMNQASTVPTPEKDSNKVEVKESEMKTESSRPFLRHRFLSKEEEVQKIPERVQIPDEVFVDVFVCNVHSTDNICVNLSGENYSEKLTALEQSMLCHYEEPSTEEALNVTPGGVFAIYSKEIHSEGLWYRVKVLKVKGDQAHIEYLDYGDTGTVPTASIRSIPPRFLELPFQACTISLHGLPKTKNAEVIFRLKQMTLNKDLVAEVIKKNGNTASVELFDTSSDVADININTMLRALVIPDTELAPVLPKPGEQIEVCVVHATLEGHVFIQIPGGGIARLEELNEDLSEHYSQQTKAAGFISSPSKDKICCAKRSVDGAWYRAIITEILPDRIVEVQYVDYGNTEELPISSLREPARTIAHINSLPFQALKCRLEGTDKKPLSDEQAYEIIAYGTVQLEVAEAADVPVVRLFVPSEGDAGPLVNFSELIGVETETQMDDQNKERFLGNGVSPSGDVAQSFDETGSVDGDSVASESSSETSKSQEESGKIAGTLSSPLDLSKPWVDISILEFDDPGLFMFQCLELLQQKEVLEEKIQDYYANKEKTALKEIRPGVLCAVLNADDSTWYRAVIKASLSPQQTCVRFADYGDFGIVQSTSLQALPDEFKQLPLMAVQGCLHGVEPAGDDLAGWSQQAIRRFGELAAGKKLVAKPMGLSSHSRSTIEEPKISLELYDTSEGNHDLLIADVLVSEELARKINDS